MKEKTLKLKCNVNLLNKKVIEYVDNELEKFCEHTNNNTMEVISEHITEIIENDWFVFTEHDDEYIYVFLDDSRIEGPILTIKQDVLSIDPDEMDQFTEYVNIVLLYHVLSYSMINIFEHVQYIELK